MNKVKVFYRDESASYPGKYMIRADLDKFYLGCTEGSYNVIGARLMGLTYAQYLRMCRDVYGAEIIGKGNKYPVAYFKLSNELNALIEQLNTRANLVLWEREHPDFEEHKAIVKENERQWRKVVYTNALGLKTKKCNKCEEILPATNEFFSDNDLSKDKLHSICKKCR